MHIKLLLLWTTLSSLSIPGCQSETNGNSPESPPPEFEGARECPQGSDSLLSECFKLVLKDYDQWASSGISELEVGSYDPAHVPDISLRVVGDLRYTWTNIRLFGGTKPSEENLEVNTKNRTIYLVYKFPLISLTADYERTGHILWLSLRDTGNVELNMTKVYVEVIVNLNIVQEDGEPLLRVQDVVFKRIDIADIRIHVPNLAATGLWGQILNSFINRNIKWIHKRFIEPEVRPRLLDFLNLYWKRIIPVTLSASYFVKT